jgi:hypothetical protein
VMLEGHPCMSGVQRDRSSNYVDVNRAIRARRETFNAILLGRPAWPGS